MKQAHIFTLMLLLLASCTNKQNKEQPESGSKEQSKQSGIVTVIISPNKQIGEISVADGPKLMPSLFIFNGYFNERIFGVTSASEEKVYNFELFAPETNLSYSHHNGHTYSYYVNPDDTIKITFQDGTPIATSSNKQITEYDLNWLSNFLAKDSNSQFKEAKIATTFDNEKRKQLIEDYTKLKEKKNNYIDSLKAKDQISAEIFPCIQREIFLDSIRNEAYLKTYEYKYFKDSIISDKDLFFNSYIAYINMYIGKKYIIKGYDPRKIFDGILTDENLYPKTKLAFLFQNLAEIGQGGTNKDFDPRAEKFLELTKGDTIWTKFIEDIAPLTVIQSNEMQLYDTNMRQVDFAELMNSYKGKVVYIDVWASWCAPCRAAMPAAKEIRTKYKDSSVIFLYLALNDQQSPWKKGVEQYSLNEGNASSYLIASPESQWIKDMEIKSIPRYIIYDKEGKLVSKNAPDPKNKQLVELIDSLL